LDFILLVDKPIRKKNEPQTAMQTLLGVCML